MMLADLENECREMVKRGFNLLDADARAHIDPETLDVELAEDCPLGQAYGNFDLGMLNVFSSNGMYDERAALYEATRCGFYVPSDAPNYYSRYAILTRMWREMLETERTVNAIEKLMQPVGSF